jgi:hypothetical protein
MKKPLAALLFCFAAAAGGQGYHPPQHTLPPPQLGTDPQAEADKGIDVERDRAAPWLLAEHRRLSATLAALTPQRRGMVDAYVVVAGLDSDAVFGREAREAAAVLSRRYHAEGRTILLAGSDGKADSAAPMGSPDHLALALARVAEVMDVNEDVLVLYTTSHGAPFGIYYNDGDQGYGAISPMRLWQQLSALGIRNRLILVSACYSGVFVPMLSSDTTAIVTASSADRTSFGCQADNDWTFFGDALVNTALRKPQPLAAAAEEARGLIGTWEAAGGLKPSQPQVSIGAGAARWLATLEAQLPSATAKVGRPATDALKP